MDGGGGGGVLAQSFLVLDVWMDQKLVITHFEFKIQLEVVFPSFAALALITQ